MNKWIEFPQNDPDFLGQQLLCWTEFGYPHVLIAMNDPDDRNKIVWVDVKSGKEIPYAETYVTHFMRLEDIVGPHGKTMPKLKD